MGEIARAKAPRDDMPKLPEGSADDELTLEFVSGPGTMPHLRIRLKDSVKDFEPRVYMFDMTDFKGRADF